MEGKLAPVRSKKAPKKVSGDSLRALKPPPFQPVQFAKLVAKVPAGDRWQSPVVPACQKYDPKRPHALETLRQILRTRTRDAHASLDTEIGDVSDEAGYRRYATGLYAFRAPIEARIAATALPPGLSDWSPMFIAASLARDLGDLGIPLAHTKPIAKSVSDQSALVGTLYVLEGASIGSQILRKRADALGYDASFGARHLSGSVAAAENWKAFVARMNLAHGIVADTAAAAALSTFAAALEAFRDAR